MKNKALNVGQVVFVLSNKAQAVLPALVIQEHRTKHLKGEEVTWTIQYGPPGKQKTVESHRIDGELYSTLDEVQKVMNSRFEEFVADLVGKAAQLEQKWYPRSQVAAQTANSDRLDPEAMMLEVADEQPQVRTSPTPMRENFSQFSQSRSAEEERERLKRMMVEDEEEEEVSHEKMKLLSDGTVVAG